MQRVGRTPAWAVVNLLLVVALAAAWSCRGVPRQRPIELGDSATGPGSLADARQRLEGRWELVSARARNTQGQLVDVEARGSLIYDAFGNYISTGEIIDAPGVAVPGDVFAQKGRAVIDASQSKLWVKPDDMDDDVADQIPAHLAPEQVRRYAFDGDTLTLTTEDAEGSTMAVLRFRRVAS
jgi:hypothetical protein